jgi:Polyketide cyclase / dehydrase and lipid transport
MTYPTAESRDIAAPAETVWALVADLPKMGDLSPENAGGEWGGGASGPSVGATFTGTNKNGFRRWSTTATVTECEPGRVFEIAITSGRSPIAAWRYEFEALAAGDGCRVTESWEDRRKPLMRLAARPLGKHDDAHAKSEMAATLANLAAAVEH